jgi:hypothetical protein
MQPPDAWLQGRRLSVDVPEGSPSFLSPDLPKRRGDRAYTNPVMPHRQLNDLSPPPVLSALKTEFSRRFAPKARVGPSIVSLVGIEALHLVEADVRRQSIIDSEFAHFHNEDSGAGSMHMLLSPADARLAIAQEWAELHLLAGETRLVGGKVHLLPPSLVLTYAPRDLDELQVALQLLDAAFKYVTSPPARA